MRVLMHLRPDWRELPGGDLVQLQRWGTWLTELGDEPGDGGERGVQVCYSDALQPDLTGIDLVHFHNLGRAFALWEPLQHCRQYGVPTVLTPLYWPTEEYEDHGRPGLSGFLVSLLPRGVRDRLKSAARWLLQPGQRGALLHEVWSGHAALARRFLSGFDAFITNSSAERAELQRLLPEPSAPIHVVHSGVDARYWSNDRELWAREHGRGAWVARERAWVARPESSTGVVSRDSATTPFEDSGRATPDAIETEDEVPAPREGVLCVARFDPQKAQHRLIRALRPLDTPLTLAGPDNPNYPGYRAFCQRIGGPGLTLLPRQNPAQLTALYRRCRVHALCSWYETTGLTGLEAGCCGARVVMTDRGGTRDYGGDRAWYADPADLYSIGRTVEKALEADDTPDLHQRVVEHFTWEKSAAALLEAYEQVLSLRPSARRAA